MNIQITAKELLDKGKWDEACEIKGLNPWCINEGMMDSSESLSFTLKEAEQLGLINK